MSFNFIDQSNLSHHKRYPRTPTYRSWDSMKQRCLNKNNVAYNRYGGAGITVCTSWLDYSNFLKDMGERPKGKTLDRIDGTKGYYKENCRWATVSEQRRNSKTYKHGKIIYHEYRTDSKKHWRAKYITSEGTKNKIFLTKEEGVAWLCQFPS